uniref:Uncharacterized protein n=1 Tax=Nothobranchius furzeri TaxID=105023 RepID=A0A1A7ZNP0_NOTFU
MATLVNDCSLSSSTSPCCSFLLESHCCLLRSGRGGLVTMTLALSYRAGYYGKRKRYNKFLLLDHVCVDPFRWLLDYGPAPVLTDDQTGGRQVYINISYSCFLEE